MNKFKLAAASILFLIAGSVNAAAIFVGTFETDDGINWTDNPAVYSAVEAAALIFGGTADDYRISTDSSMDEGSITDTGWYSTVGISGGQELASNFSLDLGGLGYAADGWVEGDDISAYVDDNAIGSDFTMYVWQVQSVSSPATVSMFVMGFLLIATRRYIKR